VWERGDHDTLRRWFGAIPHADLLSNSKLAIMDGWLHFTSGKYSEAEEILSHAVKESVQDDELHGRLLAVRAHLATFRGSPQETIGYAQQALGLLSRSTWWASAAIAYADALSLQGDSAAEGRYQEALNTPTRNIYLLLNAGFKLASSGRQNRALRQAYEVCSQSIALAEQHGLSQTTMAGCLYALRGDILCEWNRMAEALAQTAQAMDTITNNKHVGLIGWITIYRIRCLLAARRMDEAQAAFAHLDTLSLPLPIWLAKPLTALRALLWIAQGRTAELADWISAGRFSPSDPGLHMRSLEYLVYARVLMMQEQYDDARMILTQLTAHGDIRTRIAVMMPAQIMLTLIHLAQNRISEAEESLICAVNMGSNFGYLRTFLDGGKALIPLLREVWDAAPEYVDTLLSAFSEPLRTNTLPDPLSEREHEILRLVAAGLKNQEIADKLVISLNTVLYHNKNIFGKLGVEHRTQAVARARELSLI
jgi:LuxR family transcriptional regulator, maltose regulon positive regulatory protein